ncbi:MAG: hypothetical protein ACYS22_06435 [Planctomycetota bacterium]|jgi:hypothetical protein
MRPLSGESSYEDYETGDASQLELSPAENLDLEEAVRLSMVELRSLEKLFENEDPEAVLLQKEVIKRFVKEVRVNFDAGPTRREVAIRTASSP